MTLATSGILTASPGIQTPIVVDRSGYQGQLGASWDDYLFQRDRSDIKHLKLFFYQQELWTIDMGWEGIDHAQVSDLFTYILIYWFSLRPQIPCISLGRCLLEKAKVAAASPDLVVYVGEDYPRWQPGEPRRINLEQWRVPDLVGEIADTSLAIDLDETKQLYASLGIPEYWVIDVQGQRVFAFQLQAEGKYQICQTSQVLVGLPIELLEQTLKRLQLETNVSAALWFSQQITARSL